MISIIFACSDEVKDKAKTAGFVERTVLVRQESCLSTCEEKTRIERDLVALRPHQFLVADYWGMGVD